MKITLVPINLWSYKKMKLDDNENTYCYTVKNPLTNTEEDIYIEADSFENAKIKVEHRLRNTPKIVVDGFQVNEE